MTDGMTESSTRGEVPGRQKPAVTFAVAALNEQRLITEFVEEAHGVVSSLLDDYQFILVDDGSTDRTGELMDRLAAALPNTSVIHNAANLGLGRSYKKALGEARCEYYMLLCGDGGLPAQSLPPILARVGTADMVLPYMTNLDRIKTPFRLFVSRLYTRLLNAWSGLDIRYYNGLAVHRTALLRSMDIRNQGFGFQAEIIVRLARKGCSYTQVGVEGAERSGGSRALQLANIVGVARMLLLLAFRR